MKATRSFARRQKRRAIPATDSSQDPPIQSPQSTTGNFLYDDLPQEVRDYLATAEASDWKPTAILARIRMCGVEDTLKFLQASDENRRRAAYASRGFTIDPATGESLLSQ